MKLVIENEEFKTALREALRDPEVIALIEEHITQRGLIAPWRASIRSGIETPWRKS